MDILSIILIGVGLAMDCFAVSTTKGISAGAKGVNPLAWVLLMALFFGLFQGGMPLIGFFAGRLFADFFSRFAPWIALVLLGIIGGKMLFEKPDEDDASHASDHLFTFPNLMVLAVATSIDALATGVIFIPCPEKIWIGVSLIAVISFCFSIVGYWMGRACGKKMHFNVERMGGIILILIGLKIWVEGLFF